MGILIQGQIEQITTRKDRTIRVTLGTQEMNPQQSSELFTLNNNLVNVYLSDKKISNEAMIEIDKTTSELVDKSKTPSQRLRSVMYLLYHNDNGDFKSSEDFYNAKMEAIIEFYKEKLPKND